MDPIVFTKVALAHGWLGNMAPYRITFEEQEWRTSEALFQALRFDPMDPAREAIRLQTSPMAAKMVAKKNRARMIVVPRSEADVALMRQVVRLKVDQHSRVKNLLLATGDAEIIEDASARPNASGLFWGSVRQPDGKWKGLNALGRLWMELREEIRAV